jgi:hypothetical protein
MSHMHDMSDEEAAEKRQDAGLLAQAAETIGEPLLEGELAHLSLEDHQRIADALVKAANAGWNLAVQRRLSQIENQQNQQRGI